MDSGAIASTLSEVTHRGEILSSYVHTYNIMTLFFVKTTIFGIKTVFIIIKVDCLLNWTEEAI